MKVIVIVLIIALFLALYATAFLYHNMFKPAYYSMVDDCNTLIEEDNSNTLGSVQATYINDSYQVTDFSIKVDEASPIFTPVLKHELCHVKEIEAGKIHFCNETVGRLDRYFDELECYFKMYL